MNTLIPQREHFDRAELLSPAWRLTKDNRTAACDVWSHEFGFELRLTLAGDDFPRTQVCHSHEEMISHQDDWRAALETKGWKRADVCT